MLLLICLYILMLLLVKWLIPQNSKHGEQRHLLLVSASIQLFFFIHKYIIFACTSSSEYICFIFKWLLMVTLLSSTQRSSLRGLSESWAQLSAGLRYEFYLKLFTLLLFIKLFFLLFILVSSSNFLLFKIFLNIFKLGTLLYF